MFNPNRLRLARKRRRLTSKRLAELADITPVTLSRIEKGLNEPSDETLTALAEALNYSIEFFEGDDIDEVAVESASFRSLTSMTAAERDSALAASSIAFLFSDWALERFRLPDPDIPKIEHEKDPATAARLLRDSWGLGEKPVSNMVKLLEAKGVRVFSLAEETKRVDAFSCWRGNTPYIFLNTYKSAERSRFDAAHELGHLILHRHGGPRQDRYVEREADAFASSFLMPRTDVLSRIEYVNSLDALIRAKRRWGVSLSALVYRLHKLGVITDWQNRMFNIQINKRGYRTSEPMAMEREVSSVWRTVFSELWKEKVTRKDIAYELKIPELELEDIVFGLLSDIQSGANTKSTGAFRVVGDNQSV